MQFLKNHWFGLIGTLIVLVFVFVFTIVFFSPRQDAQNRGFIPCTQELAESLLSCEQGKKIRCLFASVSRNTWCDMKVIGTGFVDWLQDKQLAPWSNYFFTPELVYDEGFSAEEEAEYLKENPTPEIEMPELRKLHKELENDIIEQEDVTEDEKPQ